MSNDYNILQQENGTVTPENLAAAPVVMRTKNRARKWILFGAGIAALAMGAATALFYLNSQKTPASTTTSLTAKPTTTAGGACGYGFISPVATSTDTSTGTADSSTPTGVKTIASDETVKSQTLTATASDQSGVLVTGGTSTLSNTTVQKSGDSTNVDSSNFSGVNAGVLTTGGTLNIDKSTINTTSEGSNGIFATGSSSVINVSDTKVTTTANSARGLDVTYGGTINAKNMTISTQGEHSAAIASDRGSGFMNVACGTFTTAGEGSPGIYATGTFTVNGAAITATGSEAAVIEGGNSITMENTNITGSVKNGVMIYRSFSGDAGGNNSTYSMKNSTLTSKAGSLFYVTNTTTNILLTNNTLKNSTDTLLSAAADQWGNSGSNGGNATVAASKQALNGAIIVDSISSLTMKLTDSSELTSTINSAKSSGNIALSLDKTSTLTLSGDSYITSLTDEDSSLANIKSNGHNLYYDSTNSANAWLSGKTITLSGGGKLLPR